MPSLRNWRAFSQSHLAFPCRPFTGRRLTAGRSGVSAPHCLLNSDWHRVGVLWTRRLAQTVLTCRDLWGASMRPPAPRWRDSRGGCFYRFVVTILHIYHCHYHCHHPWHRYHSPSLGVPQDRWWLPPPNEGRNCIPLALSGMRLCSPCSTFAA